MGSKCVSCSFTSDLPIGGFPILLIFNVSVAFVFFIFCHKLKVEKVTISPLERASGLRSVNQC